MAEQKSGGNKKRKRKSRYQHSILRQEKRKAKWLNILHGNSKAQRPKKKIATTLTFWENVTPKKIRPVTFDEQYKSYRKTKGRQGLNYNPVKRQDENIWVKGRYQKRGLDGNIIWDSKHHYLCGRFPITELMEKPIQYSKPRKQ